MLLEGALPACPRISLPIVDVRDVADLHLRALDASAAIGERFIAASTPPLWLDDIARILKTNLNGAAKRVPSRSAPDWMVRAAAFISPTLQAALPSLGRTQRLSNEKARATLGWTPRPAEETILAFAESLMALSGRRAEEAHAA
jgi:dihydroflavonol-4-reductase